MSGFYETFQFSDQVLSYQKTPDFLLYPMTNVFFAVGGVKSCAMCMDELEKGQTAASDNLRNF